MTEAVATPTGERGNTGFAIQPVLSPDGESVAYVQGSQLKRVAVAGGVPADDPAIRRAIDRTGRPIVLSLSPGETALTAADHVKRHANMWRISADFWDAEDTSLESTMERTLWW